MKTLLRWLLRLLYGYRAFGTASLSGAGPLLLVPNHVSWLDWLFLGVVLDDDWKFVTASRTANTSWLHGRIMRSRRTFPVDTMSPYAVKAMAEYLERGGKLVLFAEGRISLTGGLMKLFEGTGFLVRRTGARVVTCYLRGANRLPWVRHAGWTRWFPRVTAHFGPPLLPPCTEGASAAVARTRLTRWLRDQMVRQQFDVEMEHGPSDVVAAVAETGAQIPGRLALEDVSGQKLTYRRLLVATDVLSRVWSRQLSTPAGGRVGVLLPNVNATPLVLLSLWTAHRVPAVLNPTSGLAALLACAQLAGLQEVITSRVFLERAKVDAAALTAAGLRVVWLEDVKAKVPRVAQWTAMVRQLLGIGGRRFARRRHGEATAVVLFTSGSEGVPKGVELTHLNLLANVRQATAVTDLTDDDRFFNALPLFHSFGLTAGTLFPLVRGCYTFLYPTPLHYRIVPELVYDRACTVLLGTNTFLQGYARKAHPYDFNSVRYLVAGAEKIQSVTVEMWARRFGVRVLEGYGATECSPCLSLNSRVDPKVGTAGRLLPGIEYRLEPIDGVDRGGRLHVRGPNVMKGYVNPDANATFRAGNGWYDTGDIVEIDEDGFVTICGRMKRFAKVSGEMVSLSVVEEALGAAGLAFGPRCQIAVVSMPDPNKGERLVAVTNERRLDLGLLRLAVRNAGLSNLAAPREIRHLVSIPKLSTGKTDYRTLQQQLARPPATTPERPATPEPRPEPVGACSP
jgi:acyl-[acyl-carrier-protein]-phospholipid O-acyltransferase / long-chain-fatty-acid--[acyl-carrier-protein] ligase